MNRAIRTDLAIELREDIKDRGKIDGIEIETRISQEKIKTTIIHVNDQTGADTLENRLALISPLNVRKSGNLMRISISHSVKSWHMI